MPDGDVVPIMEVKIIVEVMGIGIVMMALEVQLVDVVEEVLVTLIILLVIKKKEIYGCTDKNAYNYNPSATTNDGSCIQKIYGCTNKEAFNYNEKANVDNHSCIDKVYGCIDISAINYNKQANTKDGSCLYQEKRTEKKKIKYKTKKKYSFFRKEGKVIQKGKNGKKEITYQITRNESKEVVEKKKLSEKILVKPINKIVATKK